MQLHVYAHRGFDLTLSKILSTGVMALLATCSVASAQSVAKAWVSSTGSDTGTCDISAPCGSLQYAFNQTSVGGEVEVRDPGNYGPLTITHGVSIISSTGGATLSDYGTNPSVTDSFGIYIAARANNNVTIRGPTINRHNLSGTVGIYVVSAGTVTIDHCIISGATDGIWFISPGTYAVLSNNLITGNNAGINLQSSGYVAAGGNIISGNVYGLYNGTIYTYGDNLVNTNTLADESNVTSHSVSKY